MANIEYVWFGEEKDMSYGMDCTNAFTSWFNNEIAKDRTK